MNIQEAIKSGKPFKRGDSGAWIKVFPDNLLRLYETLNQQRVCLDGEDILADDWEIKE